MFKVLVKTQSPDVLDLLLEVQKHSGEATDQNLADGEDLDETTDPVRCRACWLKVRRHQASVCRHQA